MKPDSLELLAALSELAPLERERFVDHHALGMSTRQLAERDNVSRSAILNSLADARHRLLRRLGAE